MMHCFGLPLNEEFTSRLLVTLMADTYRIFTDKMLERNDVIQYVLQTCTMGTEPEGRG